MTRDEVLELLTDLIELEDESVQLSENTLIQDTIFDSITKLGVLSFLDNYSKTKRTVQEILDCKKISDLIDFVV